MRAVIDTNVLVSGVLSPSGPSRGLLELMGRHHIVGVTSPVLLDECERVLGRFMEPAFAHEVREAYEELAEVFVPTAVPSVTRDLADDHVVAAAVEGSAECIITRDRDLLDLPPLQSISVLEPLPALHKIRGA